MQHRSWFNLFFLFVYQLFIMMCILDLKELITCLNKGFYTKLHIQCTSIETMKSDYMVQMAINEF